MTANEQLKIIAASLAELAANRDALATYINTLVPMWTTQDQAIKAAQDAVSALGQLINPLPKSPTVYSQRDPKWAGDKLGTSNVTIGGYGCLITSLASCLTDADMVMTPAQLNAWLTANSGYTNNNLLVFTAIDKLNVIKYYSLIDCANVPAPIDQLDQFVTEGWYVVVKVDFNPATLQVEEHWVRYLAGGRMVDPWVGDIAPIVPRYRGKDAAQAILRAVIYKAITA